MIQKLYGYTIDEQEFYLKKMLLITIPMIVVGIFVPAVLAVAALMWGWGAMRATFGINGAAGLFQHNIAVVVVLLILWLAIGYFAGIINFIIGVITFIKIKVIRKNGGQW